MKPGIHPKYHEVEVRCACGASWKTHSTKPELHLEICSNCHPFFTGRQKILDAEGRVDRSRGDVHPEGNPHFTLDPGTAPVWDTSFQVQGTKKTYTIADVVRAEGPRQPAVDTAPKDFPIGFLLVAAPRDIREANLTFAEGIIDQAVSGWEQATGGRAHLTVRSSGGAPSTAQNPENHIPACWSRCRMHRSRNQPWSDSR